MSRTHLLLEVTVGGHIYRVADSALTVDDAAASTSYQFAPGLDGASVADTLDLLSTTAGARSVPVQCVFPADVAALRSRGYRLSRAPCTLSSWVTGTDYAARTVLVAGEVSDPEYGEEGEPLAFSIESIARTSVVLIPPATAQVDGTTWPDGILSLATEELGISYPYVFGQPGYIDGTEWVTGSQGVWIDHQLVSVGGGNYSGLMLMVAGHPVDAETIHLSSDADIAGDEFKVWHQLDALGREIAFVDAYYDYPTRTVFSSAGVLGIGSAIADTSLQPDSGGLKPVFASWRYGAGLSPVAGDVILYLLRAQGFPIDYGRFEAAASLLAGFRFDCVIEVPVNAAEWLAANIYPLLPVTIIDGPNGVYPLVWRYDATREDATARLDVDADSAITRAGPIREESGEIANRFSLRYRYSVRAGSHTETVYRGTPEVPDAYCTVSQAAWGIRERVIETVCVYSLATAEAILAWLARAYSQPRERVRYVLPSSYGLRVGDIVRLTDSRISLVDRLGLIAEVQVDGTGSDGVEVLLVSDPLRDTLEL